jgi:HD-like signal output (HDOD) protein
MINFMLSSLNERERQILLTALTQKGINAALFSPEYMYYVKMLQYMPDVIFMEIPRMSGEQLHFLELIHKHKKLRNIPVIGFGDPLDEALKKGFVIRGISQYLQRPLKFSEILATVERLLKRVNKTVEFKAEKSDREADIALLLSNQTLPTQKIGIMVGYVSKMMAFPFTIAKVLVLSESDKAGAGDLAKVIQADPVIAANILKVSNTVFFANANRRISSIKDAIVRIGFRETKRIVLSMAVMNLFESQNHNFGFDRIDFWYHCVGTALFAERFARRIDGLNAESAFLAGLLHDFGIIIMDEFFPEIFMRVLEKTAQEAAHFIDIESGLLGIHHNDLIKELFAGWKMPEEITECVVLQSCFQENARNFDSVMKKLAVCVGMANIISKSLYLGRSCDQFIQPINNHFFTLTNLPRGLDQKTIDEVNREILVYREFLKLEKREYPTAHNGVDMSEARDIGIVNVSNDLFVPAAAYLAKEGFLVELIPPAADPATLNGRFDIIVMWSSGDCSTELIRLFSRVFCHQRQSGKDEEGVLPAMAPLIFCGPEQLDSDALTGIFFMPNRFDLRQLDRNISDILLKKEAAAAGDSPMNP